MTDKKFTGVVEPEWLNPEDPKYHWRDWLKCPCKNPHILELPYDGLPELDEKLSYPCSGTAQETDTGLRDNWRTMVTELEKPLIVLATVIKKVNNL